MERKIQRFFLSGLILCCIATSCDKGEVPTVTTSETSNIAGSEATSGGIITSEGSGVVNTRGVCWSSQTNPKITGSKTTDGAGAGTFISSMTGLNPATTYYVRAYATNSEGTGYGMAMSFTTAGDSPTTVTNPATDIVTHQAVINGQINPNYLTTTVSFEYGTSTSYGSSVDCSQSPLSGNEFFAVSALIVDLIPGTTYHFRIKAVNSLGTTYGNDNQFTTAGNSPSTVTNPATGIVTHQAVLNGQINPNYLTTAVSFEYGTSTSYGSSVDYSQSPLSGNEFFAVSALIADLIPGTTYHFRVKAVNSLGTTYGDDNQFTTTGSIPSIASESFVRKSSTAATYIAIINPNLLSTVVTVEYGTSTDYGSSAAGTPNQIDGERNTSVSASFTDLTPNITYHLRIKAVNEAGTTYGDDKTFMLPNPVTDADGNIYNTLIIGSQTWTDRNLEVTKFNDGTDIPQVTDDNLWAGLTSPGFCWYFNDEASSKGTIFGALYNWYAASSGKLCPTGWHVPSQQEWTALESYLSINGYNYDGAFNYNRYAIALAQTSGWNYSPSSGAPGNNDFPEKRNITGFSAIPAGVRDANQMIFGARGYYAIFWTSSTYSDNMAYDRGIDYSLSSVGTGIINKKSGLSIRCVKN